MLYDSIAMKEGHDPHGNWYSIEKRILDDKGNHDYVVFKDVFIRFFDTYEDALSFAEWPL